MRLFFLSFIFCLLTGSFTYAQTDFQLNGTILDDVTGLPLEGAFIICQNTSFSDSADQNGSFQLTLPEGGYTVVFGYKGYEYESQRISASIDQSDTLLIRLKKPANALDEVVVQSTPEVQDGWEKYGGHFKDYFLGRSPFAAQCVIENPDVLKFYFYKKKNKLKVKAESPVMVRNEALGYRITYRLDSFVYEYKTDFSIHSGITLFAELDSTPEQKKIWEENRENAYWGSRLHFMRSYFYNTLTEDGFLIQEVQQADTTQRFVTLADPYDSSFYTELDSTETEIYLVGNYRIIYQDAPMDRSYLEANNYSLKAKEQLSTVELKDGFIVMENGYFYEQNEVISSGYWAWKSLADQLPYDYWPPLE